MRHRWRSGRNTHIGSRPGCTIKDEPVQHRGVLASQCLDRLLRRKAAHHGTCGSERRVSGTSKRPADRALLTNQTVRTTHASQSCGSAVGALCSAATVAAIAASEAASSARVRSNSRLYTCSNCRNTRAETEPSQRDERRRRPILRHTGQSIDELWSAAAE